MDNATDRKISAYIEKAKKGDYLAAQRLVDIFHADLDAGRESPSELRDYISECHARLNRGEDYRTAFNLTRPRGRPRDPETEDRDQCLALAVDMLRRRGERLEDAIQSVAGQYHISVARLEKIYKRHKDPAYDDPFVGDQ